MPIDVACSKFSGNLAHLNGVQRINCSQYKILLSALTCGYDGFFRSFGEDWLRRVVHIIGAISPFIRSHTNCGFCLSQYYFDTDKSESTQGIYFIGQALTKIFSQEILDAPLVLHASKCDWEAGVGGASKAPLKEIGRKEADLLAFDRRGGFHVLESKGRSVSDGSLNLSASKFNSAMQEALAQVSAIAGVNGAEPLSRCACVWSICTSGVKGNVVDPDGGGRNLRAEPADIIASNYALVLESAEAPYVSDFIPGYDVIDLGDGIYFGVSSNIRKALLRGESDLDFFISAGSSARPGGLEAKNTSTMRDGTLLYASKRQSDD